MSQRWLYASISYDGSRFQGFQIQPNAVTVQGELQKVISAILQTPVAVHGASRTDSGVHALDQRILMCGHFRTSASRIPHILNRHFEYIRINAVTDAPDDFNLKAISHEKTYTYQIRFQKFYAFHQPYSWCREDSFAGLDAWNQALNLFCGRHNFRLLSKVDKTRKTTDFYRSIHQCQMQEKEHGFYEITIQGDGFLWMMIRFMIAYADAILAEKLPPEDLKAMLRGEKFDLARRPMIRPAPAGGLYLSRSHLIPQDGIPKDLESSLHGNPN